MSRDAIERAALERELALLPQLSPDELKARWLALKGVPLPKFMRRGLMTLAVAHACQVRALGGLDRDSQKRLDKLVAQIVPTGERAPPPPNRKIKAGTRLLREWRGQVHEITVTSEGFLWKGERHRSLSQIAYRIAGTRWNGWSFFGLKKPARPAPEGSAPTKGLRRRKRAPEAPVPRPRPEPAHA